MTKAGNNLIAAAMAIGNKITLLNRLPPFWGSGHLGDPRRAMFRRRGDTEPFDREGRLE